MGLLDSRERAILFKMAQGKTYLEIGRELRPKIGERVVAKSVASIFAKLGARDKAHAVALGILTGELAEWQMKAITKTVNLTPRERDIITCMDRRLGVDDIAVELDLTPLSVRTHIKRIFVKMSVSSWSEAIEAARYYGYLT